MPEDCCRKTPLSSSQTVAKKPGQCKHRSDSHAAFMRLVVFNDNLCKRRISTALHCWDTLWSPFCFDRVCPFFFFCDELADLFTCFWEEERLTISVMPNYSDRISQGDQMLQYSWVARIHSPTEEYDTTFIFQECRLCVCSNFFFLFLVSTLWYWAVSVSFTPKGGNTEDRQRCLWSVCYKRRTWVEGRFLLHPELISSWEVQLIVWILQAFRIDQQALEKETREVLPIMFVCEFTRGYLELK